MKEILTVTLVQFAPEWEKKSCNLDHCCRLLDSCGPTDLVVLPEMFTTGFSMNVGLLAENMDGPTIKWMQAKAAGLNVTLTGSTLIREGENYFNRLLWVTPDGGVQWYDKRHLFAIGDEHLYYTPGDRRITFTLDGWKIRALICYDLRFPVWSRNHDDYDLLLYVANWPSARHHVWKNLLVARALENQCYCVAVNRTGEDGMGLRYLGDSGLVDPRGMPEWMEEKAGVKNYSLSYTSLQSFRSKFPILRDRDEFSIS